MHVAVLGEVDKGRQFRAGLGGFNGTLVGGGDVVVGAGAGEVVIGAGVGEQVVDRLGLAVLVDGCAEGERLADGGLTVLVGRFGGTVIGGRGVVVLVVASVVEGRHERGGVDVGGGVVTLPHTLTLLNVGEEVIPACTH